MAACFAVQVGGALVLAQSSSLEIQQHFRAALQAQKSGRLDAAVKEYQAVIQLQPQLAEAYANLGLVYYLQSKFEESSQALAKAAALKPELRGAGLFLGMDYVRLHRPKEAIPCLRRAIAEEPDNKQARLSLGTALWNAGERAAARQELREAARQFPMDVDALYDSGEAYQKSANRQIQKLPAKYARLLQEGKYPPGWKDSETPGSGAASSGPYEQALAEFSRKDYQAAAAKLTALLAADPNDSKARYLLARTYEGMSLAVLSRMYQVDPNSYRVHELLGRIDEDRWQNDKALAEYRIVEQTHPALPGLHLAIGEVLWRENQLDPALTEFKAGIKSDPYDARAYAEMGTVLVAKHESEMAMPYLTKALQLQPDMPLIHKQLGIVYYRQKNYAYAEQELEKALPADHDGSVHFLLGAVFRDSGHPQKAKAEMEKARAIQSASERQAEAATQNAASTRP